MLGRACATAPAGNISVMRATTIGRARWRRMTVPRWEEARIRCRSANATKARGAGARIIGDTLQLRRGRAATARGSGRQLQMVEVVMRVWAAVLMAMVGAACAREVPQAFPSGELVDLSHTLRRDDDLLADGRALPAREGGRRHHAGRLLLRRQQLLHVRARRHAPRCAGPFRHRAHPDRRSDSARSARRRRRSSSTSPRRPTRTPTIR